MQSKISCFNKAIFKKNLTRFWPFAVLYAVYLFMIHPMSMYLEFTNWYTNPGDRQAWELVGNHFSNLTEPFSVCAAAIVIAIAVFSYLYQSRSANMIHAFPVTRTELFVTNYLSGLVLMVLPQLLTALATNLVILGKANSMIWMVWAWFGITLGETLFFFSFACFIVMFTGQILAAGLFYVIWNCLYGAAVVLINVVGDMIIYGISGSLINNPVCPLFPVAYMVREIGFYRYGELNNYQLDGISVVLLYAAAGLVLAVLGWFIYQKRRIECAGDFLSMKWTAPVFRWGTAMIVGVAGALCWTYLTGEYTSTNRMVTRFVIFLVICSFVLFFVAEMFVEKSFRVLKKRIALENICCVAVLLAGVALLWFDAFGVETYVPETDQIKVVSLGGNGSVCFEDTSDIEEVRALHKLIIGQRFEQKAQDQSYRMDTISLSDVAQPKAADGRYEDYINITYELKNGRMVRRSYWIITEDPSFRDMLWAQSESLFNDTEALKRSCLGMNYEELNWQLVTGYVSYSVPDDTGEYLYNSYPLYGSKEQLQKIYDAIVADFDAGAFGQYGRPDTGKLSASVNLTLFTERKGIEIYYASDGGHMSYFDGEDRADGTNMYVDLNINENCTNLIDALIDLGIITSADDLCVPEGDTGADYEKYIQ